jgi:hypothetical protein
VQLLATGYSIELAQDELARSTVARVPSFAWMILLIPQNSGQSTIHR